MMMLQKLFFKFILELTIIYVSLHTMNEFIKLSYLFLQNRILIMHLCMQ